MTPQFASCSGAVVGRSIGGRVGGWRRILLAAAVAAAPAHATGQTTVSLSTDLHHTGWIAGRDLPIAGFNEIARTPDGYLWLGSTAGLVRFDGARFVVLDGATVPALESSVPGGHVPLLVDRTGTLWIRRADGALVHYRDGGFTVAVAADSALPRIASMVEDRLGRLWLQGAARMYSWREGRIAAPALPPAVPDTGITGIVRDDGYGIWVGTRSQGLWRVTPYGGYRQARPHAPDDPLVRPMLHDDAGRLWVAGDRLQLLSGGVWTRPLVHDQPVLPSAMAQSPDGSIWMATSGHGILRFDDGAIERFGPDDGLTNAVVNALLLDAEGSIWVTTDAGLDQLRPAAFTAIGRRQGLPFDAPLLVLGDATSGVYATDYASLRTWHLDAGVTRRDRAGAAATLLPETDIPFASGRAGGIWRFRLHSDLVYHLRDGVATRVLAAPGLAWTGPRRGFEDAGGTLWLGSGSGGFGRVRDFRYEPVALPGAGDAPRIASIAGDGRGRVWVSISQQPLLFEIADDGATRRFDVAAGVPAPLLNLALEAGDTLWATTAAGALVRLIGGRATSLRIPDVANAFAAGSVVLVASRSHLWFGSQGGIGRLPLDGLHAAADGRAATPQPRWFGELDGLRIGRTNDTNTSAGFRAHDGRIWFATPAGLAAVDPDAMPTNTVAPIPIVEEVRVTGRRDGVATDGTIAANPERLEIHFTAASLRMPERVRIDYRLDGADPDWIPADPGRSASYTQLRPGTYVFRVRARNEDGVPSASEATMSFHVLPAWYQAAWFRLLALLGAAAAGTSVVAVYIRASHRAAANRMRERYEAALDERTRMARELHDTLLQAFTGITLHLQAIERLVVDAPADAAAALSRILSMADAALRDARLAIWDMRAPELDGHDLPEALEAVARRTVDGAPLRLSFAVEGPQRRLPLVVETTVLRVGREAAANVVRHAAAHTVAITLSYQPETVTLRVQDDGRGFDPDVPAPEIGDAHWGIRGMRERAASVGGSLAIMGAIGAGTAIELRLPTADRGALEPTA